MLEVDGGSLLAPMQEKLGAEDPTLGASVRRLRQLAAARRLGYDARPLREAELYEEVFDVMLPRGYDPAQACCGGVTACARDRTRENNPAQMVEAT